MAENSAASVQPIILKRIKKAAHGSHGGVWKLAYADFVTAMMAFFLLLWLLNSVTQEQLQGISNYFAPVTTSRSQTGSGQVLGGKTVGDPGAAESPTSRATVTQDLPPPKVGTGAEAGEGAAEDDGRKAQEEEQFKDAEQELRKQVESVPALRQLANSLLVDNTPEGLRIQLVDQQGLALFPAGSSEMYLHTRRLLEVVAKVILDMPQKISISGHTDSTGYVDETKFSNWELSSDRANAARRALLGFHVPKERVGLVTGKAYVDPLKPEDPTHPSNRRLTVVLLRGTGDPGSVVKKPAQGEPRRIREALPGLDALRERQIQDDGKSLPPAAPPATTPPAVPAPSAAPPAVSPPASSSKAGAAVPPPAAAPTGAQPTLPGLDAIRERQRREETAKQKQK